MYKLQGVHLLGVSQQHDVHINWHPQGISLELSPNEVSIYGGVGEWIDR